MVHFIKILYIVLFAVFMIGCAASPETNNKDDYMNGKVEAGWLYGMSPERMKQYIDGVTDSKLKEEYSKIYLKALEEKLKSNQPTTNSNSVPEIGKVIINNETNYSVKLGVEGPIEKSWTFTGKGIQRDNLPPGEYLQYWERNGKKKYKMQDVYYYDEHGKRKKVQEYDVLKIELTTTASFNGEECNGVLNYHR